MTDNNSSWSCRVSKGGLYYEDSCRSCCSLYQNEQWEDSYVLVLLPLSFCSTLRGPFRQHFRWRPSVAHPPSCTQTACLIWLSLTYSLCQFIYSDNICICAWRFCWKGITDALVFVKSRLSWLSCWFGDAIWSRESCVATIATRRLLLKYSQSGWRRNKSSKSNAIYLAGSLRVSAQLYETTQLFAFAWESAVRHYNNQSPGG